MSITALLACVNARFIRLPTTIGVPTIALALALILMGLSHFGLTTFATEERQLLGSIDFIEVLMQGMLSQLLFAGALHVEIRQLCHDRRQIALLAPGGTRPLFSLASARGGSWGCAAFHCHCPTAWCSARSSHPRTRSPC